MLTEGRGAAILKSSDKERTARPSAHTCSSACRSSALPNLPPGAARAPPGHGKAPAPAPRGDTGTEQRGSRKPDGPALPSPPQTHQLRVPNPPSGGYLPAAGAHKPGQSLRHPLHPRSTRAPSNFPLPLKRPEKGSPDLLTRAALTYRRGVGRAASGRQPRRLPPQLGQLSLAAPAPAPGRRRPLQRPRLGAGGGPRALGRRAAGAALLGGGRRPLPRGELPHRAPLRHLRREERAESPASHGAGWGGTPFPPSLRGK